MDTVPGYGKLSGGVQEGRRLHDIGDVPGHRDDLRALRACGVRISGPRVTVLAELAKQVAFEQLPGVRDAARGWLGDAPGMEPVTRAELGRRMRAGGVLVIDVRPAAEYAAAHIAGAVSIPLDELAARLAELPRSAEVVAYCRGRFCVMSLDAVRLLREHGYRARPMDGGLPEWDSFTDQAAGAWPAAGTQSPGPPALAAADGIAGVDRAVREEHGTGEYQCSCDGRAPWASRYAGWQAARSALNCQRDARRG
jgi:rhodanese-related sulfurtransferase